MSSEEKGGRHTEKFKVKMGAEIGVKECLKLPGAGRELDLGWRAGQERLERVGTGVEDTTSS